MDYDGSYHQLYSHPEMIEDLLRHFVDEPLIIDLDFSTLEQINAKFYIDPLLDENAQAEKREGDLIFRILTKSGAPVYLYILLEFQSSPDTWMSIRIATYVFLLYQYLIKQKQLTANGKLPPVFPLVLYNGNRKWNGPLTVKSLIDLPAKSLLWKYQPHAAYYLVDENLYPSGKENSISGMLFKFENMQDHDQLLQGMIELGRFLSDNKLGQLKQDILAWVKHVLEPLKQLNFPFANIEALTEGNHMGLRTRIEEWQETLLKSGIEQGIEQGIEKGKVEGKIEGEQKMLVKIAQHRFGTLPPQYLQKIEQATNEQLEQWGIKILDAKSLDDIFH